MAQSLTNYIKYCLGYIKLTRERTFAAQQKYSIHLSKQYFSLIALLNGDIDGNAGELINLQTFYSYDPNKVPEEVKDKYEQEKALANKIEDIYNKHKNDEFTKQVIFNFGYFEVEIPLVIEENGADTENEGEEEPTKPQVKIDRYPLFSFPVRIEKEIANGVGRYFVYPVDLEIQVNVGMLEGLLGEDLYYQVVEQMGQYEIDEKLVLPITVPDVFIEIWHKIKAQLRLREAKFDEDSFSLEEMQIALSPRANYFLAEDLQKLSKLSEEELKGTGLTSWTENDELNIETGVPHEKDLYFPFLYDKYQLRSLSVINNKAAIIQGPPGTGKSETIANLLCHLAATGKRVLFVSQKSQALKVVKDKLKKLDVKYLCGYIPNPSSAQIGEDDESDGIAPQLTALDSYIEKMSHKTYGRKHSGTYGGSAPALAPIVEEKAGLKGSIASLIEAQRRYYQLHQELKKLQDFDISISDLVSFERCTLSAWQEVKGLLDAIEALSRAIRDYEKTEQKRRFDTLFAAINLLGKRCSASIQTIQRDVAKSGYDRHSRFWRKMNNMVRNFRTSKARSGLPREIIDYIDRSLNGNIPRSQAESILSSLYQYGRYREGIGELQELQENLQKRLQACGLSNQEFRIVDDVTRRIEGNSFDEVRRAILRVYQIKDELQGLKRSSNINGIASQLKGTEEKRRECVAGYIQNVIDKNILEKWKQGVTVRQIIKKLARALGKSKKAFKTFDNLRKDPANFNAILDLIPVWIMELDDASRIIPLEAGIFDYVILDEASQCNVAYTLPVTFRSKHVLFVGDSEQMRDNTIMFKSNKSFDELAHRYQIPEELQIKATASAVQSVLDIAALRGFMSIPLRYHYRSPAELIGFSNKYFYKPRGKELIPLNNNYLTYKDTNRVMLVHQVESDWKEEFSDNVNVAESKAILELFKSLRSDERYRGKSIGILTFFNAQAAYIRKLFEQEGFKEEDDNYKVSIIEGIQGDEKDIVLYSFVIRTPEHRNKYMPLTGEGGDIRGDINRGRVNVAFSRARLQVHCFISLPVDQMPERIWIKKYLEYVQENGEINFHSTELKPFDSYFEEEFCNLVRAVIKRNYKIQNQVESCGFRIDFVISNSKSSKTIAIECDGPTHFKDEIDEEYGIYIESDEERQHVLQAAGWQFYRIKYSDWIDETFDRKAVIEDIIQLLN